MADEVLSVQHRMFVRVPGPLPPVGRDLRAENGWCFRHVIQVPAVKKKDRHGDYSTPEAQWYLAYQPGKPETYQRHWITPWRNARKYAPEIAEAVFERFRVWPQLVEPSPVFVDKSDSTQWIEERLTPDSGRLPVVTVGNHPSMKWPAGSRKAGFYDPVWYQDDQHTQLIAARKEMRERLRGEGREGITIGVLDTGFDIRHAAMPTHLRMTPGSDSLRVLSPYGDDPRHSSSGELSAGQKPDFGHGSGTIGILAGRRVRMVDGVDKQGRPKPPFVGDQTIELGGAPDATIVPVRVATTPASLSTANLAYAIDYASRVQGCDVLSISHGGSPSMMWTDAVNAAYSRGTAMFAATGDFLPLPLVPGRINRLGLLVPSSTVYPAAFRRVMSVGGITAGEKTYAMNDLRYPLGFLIPGIHGSYGADGVRRSILTLPFRDESKQTDPVQVARNNALKANPIMAYTPSTPWLLAKGGREQQRNIVDLDGGGTSSAAPQAAAAAAHWLACNRRAIQADGGWNDWRKAESVYLAMALTARRPWATGGRREDQLPDPKGFLGSGILRARDMLDVSYKQALDLEGKTLRSPYHVKGHPVLNPDIYPGTGGAPRDFFDSRHSFFDAVFATNRSNASREAISRQADFRNHQSEVRTLDTQRQEALQILYFNMMLVEQFQWGHQPIGAGNEDDMARNMRTAGVSQTLLGPNESALDRRAGVLSTGGSWAAGAMTKPKTSHAR
ncbi:hypothetical protein llg_31050 [Luteolibacter sp. LG18]|nr:hypothetical protein llg_31050 [Luteolibacter sp. LG18]